MYHLDVVLVGNGRFNLKVNNLSQRTCPRTISFTFIQFPQQQKRRNQSRQIQSNKKWLYK